MPVFCVSVQFTDRGAMGEKDAEAIAALPDALALIDELIVEIERLRPLTELWGRLEKALVAQAPARVTAYTARPWLVEMRPGDSAVGPTLPETVRSLLEEVGDER